MGITRYLDFLPSTPTQQNSTCLDVAKEAKSRERQSPGPAVLDSSSPWDVSTVCSARVTMPSVLVLEPQSTWLLRSSSWQATLLVTTRRPGSFPVTCSWLSVTTRSWTSFWPVSPLPRVVSSPTSRLSSYQRRPKRRLKLIYYNLVSIGLFKPTNIISELSDMLMTCI